jgi:sugar/nucleoside kinase (ribokinase family)
VAGDLDLLVLGDAKPDLIVSADRLPEFGEGERLVQGSVLTLGGSGGIAACGAAALGLRVAFVGVVGDDAFGRFVVESLGSHGVDTTGVVVDTELTTGLSIVVKRDEENEAVMTDVGTVSALHESHVDRSVLSSSRHVHVASLYLQEALRSGIRELFEEAHHSSASTSVDPNRDPTGNWDGGLFDLMSETDILFANSVEIRAITGVDDVDVAAQALAERGAVVAVKFGQGGGLAMWGDQVVRLEAIPIDVVDTTGGGATFAAGFIAGRLRGWSLERCLSLAVACASLSTRALGGTAAQPTMDEAVDAFEQTA